MNFKKPLVSIIIPIYNTQSEILSQALYSAMQQTHKPVEIVLVNDGSNKKTLSKLYKITQEHKNIILINKPNEGVNFARRDGFFASHGEYVTFFDSDDVLNKNFIKIHLKRLLENKSEVSVSKTKRFYTTSPKILFLQKQSQAFTVSNKKDILKTLLVNKTPIEDIATMCVWGKLYTRNILTGLDWDIANYKHGEDYFITAQILNNSKLVIFINEYLYYYRKEREGKITNNPSFNISPDNKKVSNFYHIRKLASLFFIICQKNKITMTKEIICFFIKMHIYWIKKYYKQFKQRLLHFVHRDQLF